MSKLKGAFKAIVNGIDKLSAKLGYVTYAVLSAIILIMFYDVIMRYVFNKPTEFSLEAAELLQVVLVASAVAYVLREEGHVSIELVTERLSPRLRNWFLCVTSVILFFVCGLMCYQIWQTAYFSLQVGMRTPDMKWNLFPFQFLLFAGLVLLALQSIVRAEKYYIATKGENPK